MYQVSDLNIEIKAIKQEGFDMNIDRNIGSAGNYVNNPEDDRRQDAESYHTPECLARRLAELEAKLYGCFPAKAADYGLDVARDAGLRYIERNKAGRACRLTYGAAWLLKVAKRAAIRYMKQHPGCVSIEIAMFSMRPRRASDEEQQEPRDLSAVRDALERLPEKQKEAVYLRVFDGLSIRKAARQMGIAPQTVGSYLKKAYASLRTTLSTPPCDNNEGAYGRAS